jgi:hypothetical protein
MARTKAQQDEAFKNPAVPMLGLGAAKRARPPTAPSSARSWREERPRTAPQRPLTSRPSDDHASKPPPSATARARTASAQCHTQHGEKRSSPEERVSKMSQRAESAHDSAQNMLAHKIRLNRPGKRPHDDTRKKQVASLTDRMCVCVRRHGTGERCSAEAKSAVGTASTTTGQYVRSPGPRRIRRGCIA